MLGRQSCIPVAPRPPFLATASTLNAKDMIVRTEFSVKLGLFLLALILIASARACAEELTHAQRWQLTKLEHRHQAKTFTKTFTLEMGLAGLSLAGDGFTTEKNNRPRWHEINPLVAHGRPPAVTGVYFASMFSGLIYSNHLLRNHPRLRHVLNFSTIGLESYWTARNATYPRKIVRR